MKKLLTILVTLTLAACLTACSAAPKAISDPVLEPVMIDGIPEGTYTNLGDGRILVSNQKTHSAQDYCIFNLKSGKRTPLSLKDEEKWRATYEERIWGYYDERTRAAADVMPLLDQLLMINDLWLGNSGENYSLFSIGYIDCLLDHRTGKLICLDVPDGGSVTLSPNDELVYTWQEGDLLFIRITDVRGKELRTAEVDIAGYDGCGLSALDKGMFLIIFDISDAGEMSNYAVILLDKQLQVSPAIPLADYETYYFYSLQHEQTGRIFVATLCDMLLLDPVSGCNYRFTCVDGELSVSELTDRGGMLMDGNAPMSEGIQVLGFSPDRSYALIITSSPGLYKLDMETLELTKQMSGTDIEAMLKASDEMYELPVPLNINDWMYTIWDGGEYAVSTQCIFRVKER